MDSDYLSTAISELALNLDTEDKDSLLGIFLNIKEGFCSTQSEL